jgi:peptidyl-tRNA hydrolase, PTH1 family
LDPESANSQSAVRNPQSRVWLIIGLGNPGPDFDRTYHNVGFRVVERIAEGHGVRFRQECGPAIISDKVTLGSETAVLVEPQTFMNRSGLVLPKIFERFQATIDDVVVIYDDLALPLGKLRVRQKGSAGGHNGIKSLISSAGSDEFMRVRIGIMPDHPIGDTRDFVLSRVSKSDRVLLDQAEEIAVKAVESLLNDGITKSMGAFNGVDLRNQSPNVSDGQKDRK